MTSVRGLPAYSKSGSDFLPAVVVQARLTHEHSLEPRQGSSHLGDPFETLERSMQRVEKRIDDFIFREFHRADCP